MSGARPAVPPFHHLAVRHLQLINDHTPPRTVRLHSHFAPTSTVLRVAER